MRILHTSDWHLGQTLHDFDRTYEHQCFLDWLLETISSTQAEALLVAGDVFDNANPSAASQKQLYRFLQQAKARNPHLNIIITAGNHDSAGRLEAPGPLLEAIDCSVVGTVPRLADGGIDLERLLLPLKDTAGAIQAWCLAIPFLRPGDVPRTDANNAKDATDSNASNDGPAGDPYMLGIALLYQQALALALSKRQPGQAILAMGHCHMIGGEVSQDSERSIVIGGTEALPAGIFDPAIAYAALGHLHMAQRVGKQERVRYCGSPLPMSFSEIDYRHQILCIDLDGENLGSIAEIPVPRSVNLLRIPKKPAPIEEVLLQLAALDPPPAADIHRQAYLQVRVRLDAPEPGLRSRIEAALEGKAVRLARIETTRNNDGNNQTDDARPVSLDDLQKLQPDDIYQRLYQQRYNSPAPPEQLAALRELMQASELTPTPTPASTPTP
jgi:exonuclease SbcD